MTISSREEQGIEGGERMREKKETVKMIYELIQRKCDQQGNNAQEIYLLSLALKELNQLEPRTIS